MRSRSIIFAGAGGRHVGVVVDTAALWRNALARFLTQRSLMKPCAPSIPGVTATLVAEYANHLREVRGLCEPTIRQHAVTVVEKQHAAGRQFNLSGFGVL